MAEWTPEATEYLDGYLKQVHALARSSEEDAEEIVAGLRDHISDKAEQESGPIVTLSILRRILAAVGSPEGIVEDSATWSSRTNASTRAAFRNEVVQPTPSPTAPHSVERVVMHAPASRSQNVLRWVVIGAILVVIAPIVLAILGVFASIMLPAFARSREAARRAACQNHLKQIGIAIEQYKDDHPNAIPRKMSDFYPKYIHDLDTFACPSSSNKNREPGELDVWSAYEFVVSWNGDNDEPIIREKDDRAHVPPGRHELYNDGRVNFVRTQYTPAPSG